MHDAGLKGKTIHIRMAGMDAPEVSEHHLISSHPIHTVLLFMLHGCALSIVRLLLFTFNEGAHFGRPEQPYYTESIAWLKENIEGRRIKCELLRRDQYERVVALPLLPRTFRPWRRGGGVTSTTRNLPLEMIRAGWGVVYTQRGAEYGSGWEKETYLAAEAEARSVPFSFSFSFLSLSQSCSLEPWIY